MHIKSSQKVFMNIYKPEHVRTLLENLYKQSQKITFCDYNERNSRIMFIPYNQIILKPCYKNFVEMVRRFV